MYDADTNKYYYYHFDGLGSVIALSNVNGEIVERYSYDVFGEPTIRDANYEIRDTSAFANPYMFTGRRYDNETGLYYYRFRYYNSKIGRFLQTDPIGYAAGLNLYAYVGNNPINWIDPWGFSTIRITTTKGTKTLIDPTMDEFGNVIKSEKDSSIKNINISGHGNRYTMMIVKGNNPLDGSIFWIPGSDKVLMSDNYNSFSDIIKSKLAKDAVIELDGCNTARQWTRGGQNIARQLSRDLPDVTIKGNRGYGIGNEWFSIRFGKETHVIGFKREYHGGN